MQEPIELEPHNWWTELIKIGLNNCNKPIRMNADNNGEPFNFRTSKNTYASRYLNETLEGQ